MAAAARIHRRDQLDPRREGDVGVGAGDADLAGLERLAQRIEHRALEFGQLVEEQHAEMGEADLARPHPQPAADQRRHRGAVVRRAERPARGSAARLELAGDAGDHRHFERLGRRQRRAGCRAGRRRAATCPRPAARSSAGCGRPPRRSRARAWRSPGPSPGRDRGRAGRIGLARPRRREHRGAAQMVEQGDEVGRGDHLDVARPGRLRRPAPPGRSGRARCAEAWSAASSTPGDGAIRPSRPSSPTAR